MSRAETANAGDEGALASFRRLVTWTIAATFALILIGGIVRVSDSGLGCGPEGSGTHGWPLCEGGVVPGASAESAIEFSHRVAAGVVAVLIAVLLWRACASSGPTAGSCAARSRPAVLVVVQAALGGLTVERGLREELVAAHLGLAMLLVGLLLLLRRAADPATDAGPAPGGRGLRAATTVAAALVLATIVAGGYVAGTEREGTPGEPVAGQAHVACGTGYSADVFPSCNGEFPGFGQSRLADIQLAHRALMYLTAIAVFAMTAIAVRRRTPSRAFVARLAAARRPDRARDPQRLGRQARRPDRRPPGPRDRPLEHGRLRRRHAAARVGAGRLPDPGPRRRRRGDRLATMESATSTGRPVEAREAGAVAGTLRVGPAGARSLVAVARDYVALTKPRIISLLLLTTVTTMIVADPDGLAISTVLWTMLGGYLAAGGAGAINHYLDRERDARMARTRGRPLVSGRIEPRHGLVFGIALGALATVQLAVTVNPLSALLALGGLLGYVFVYTIWLKPLTPQNIVIGGAAGAMPPLVGWAAATGGLAPEALYPFAIVFLWTPPHFWALSLLIADDYARTGVPMLPVVRGERATRRQIVAYSAVLFAFSLLPVATGFLGSIYLLAALALGAGFVALAVALSRAPSQRAALRLYLSSLAYLALLFCAMAADRAI